MAFAFDMLTPANQEEVFNILFTVIVLYALASNGASLIRARVIINRSDNENNEQSLIHRTILYIVLMHSTVMAVMVLGVLALFWTQR